MMTELEFMKALAELDIQTRESTERHEATQKRLRDMATLASNEFGAGNESSALELLLQAFALMVQS
jgi:hypothetical protein